MYKHMQNSSGRCRKAEITHKQVARPRGYGVLPVSLRSWYFKKPFSDVRS